MSERRIKVVLLGQAAWPGAYVTEPDDVYPVGELVPADHYLADEQDWQHVISRRGHADVGELTLAHYNGSQYVQRANWDAVCWLLVEADGTPVVQD